MTALRDALAAALLDAYLDPFVARISLREFTANMADRVLSDPAVREALVEAVQDGLSAPVNVIGYDRPIFVGTVVSWIPAITGQENVARVIVARVVGDER